MFPGYICNQMLLCSPVGRLRGADKVSEINLCLILLLWPHWQVVLLGIWSAWACCCVSLHCCLAETPVSPFRGSREFNEQAENWVAVCVGCVGVVLVGWARRWQSYGGERLQSYEPFIVPTCYLAIVLFCSFIVFLTAFLIKLSNICLAPSHSLEQISYK